MTTVSEFAIGDYVRHMNGSTGRVTEIRDRRVFVKFDRGPSHWRGEYDDLWFVLNPQGLTKITPPARRAAAE